MGNASPTESPNLGAGATSDGTHSVGHAPAPTPTMARRNPTRTYTPAQHARRVAWGKRFGAANRANWLRELRLHP